MTGHIEHIRGSQGAHDFNTEYAAKFRFGLILTPDQHLLRLVELPRGLPLGGARDQNV